MPMKTWEPSSRQSDSEIRRRPGQDAEPRNFEDPRHDRGRNHDAPAEPERNSPEYEEINTHGSER